MNYFSDDIHISSSVELVSPLLQTFSLYQISVFINELLQQSFTTACALTASTSILHFSAVYLLPSFCLFSAVFLCNKNINQTALRDGDVHDLVLDDYVKLVDITH